MEEKSLSTLEYTKILKSLSECAKNDDAKTMAEELKPSSDFREVERALAETDAAVTMSLKFGSPEILRVEPVDGAIKRLDVGGALSAAELLNVARLLKCIRNLKRYTKEQTGVLEEYFSELVSAKPIEDEINRAIVSEDEIADAASPALANVRRKMKNAGAKIKDSLDSMVRSGHYQKFLMDNIVTMRNNRYVVPVKAEHRSDVPSLLAEAACKPVQRGHSDTAAEQQRSLARERKVIAVAESAEYVEPLTRCHTAHLSRAVSDHLVYYRKLIAAAVTHRYRSAQIQPVQRDIYKLPRARYRRAVSAEAHSHNIRRYGCIFGYLEYSLFHISIHSRLFLFIFQAAPISLRSYVSEQLGKALVKVSRPAARYRAKAASLYAPARKRRAVSL